MSRDFGSFRQKVVLKFGQIVKAHDAQLAYPTQVMVPSFRLSYSSALSVVCKRNPNPVGDMVSIDMMEHSSAPPSLHGIIESQGCIYA